MFTLGPLCFRVGGGCISRCLFSHGCAGLVIKALASISLERLVSKITHYVFAELRPLNHTHTVLVEQFDFSYILIFRMLLFSVLKVKTAIN